MIRRRALLYILQIILWGIAHFNGLMEDSAILMSW